MPDAQTVDLVADALALARMQCETCDGMKNGRAEVKRARDAARTYAAVQCARNVAHALERAGLQFDNAAFLARCGVSAR